LPQIRSAYSEIQETAGAFAEMKTAVERSRKKYLGIFNNIQDVYYEVSLKGTLIEISPSIEKISQYRREELIGKTVAQNLCGSRTRELVSLDSCWTRGA
jgi:two-component system cell cycle sensor histidine kinase/response regulator CckA